eukprot:m.90818 g.90818  ORF g.90818 m.90818 type:complete len:83 (-) comp12930_c0_seq1:158-406(-)
MIHGQGASVYYIAGADAQEQFGWMLNMGIDEGDCTFLNTVNRIKSHTFQALVGKAESKFVYNPFLLLLLLLQHRLFLLRGCC